MEFVMPLTRSLFKVLDDFFYFAHYKLRITLTNFSSYTILFYQCYHLETWFLHPSNATLNQNESSCHYSLKRIFLRNEKKVSL